MPDWRPEIVARLSGLALRPEREVEILDELTQHLDQFHGELRAAGVRPEEARARTLEQLEALDVLANGLRPLRQARAPVAVVGGRPRRRLLADLWADIRDGLRSLRRSPMFTFVSVCVFALGIGLNTAIFSFLTTVFFRTLPVPAPDELAYVYASAGSRAIDLRTFRDGTQPVFRGVAAHDDTRDIVEAGGQSGQRRGEVVTANYFDVLGVGPALGRLFGPEEDDPANPARAVVLSHAFWTHRFGRDPAAVGAEIRIGGRAFTVIGIAAPGFDGLSAPWLSSSYWMTKAQSLADVPGGLRVIGLGSNLVARMRPGVSRSQARDVAARTVPEVPAGKTRQAFTIVPAAAVLIAFDPTNQGTPIRVLASALGAIGLIVLLIAATNIAGVLSARGVARTGELAVRQALGASGGRLVQQRLTESVLLAGIGGAAGLGVAWLCLHAYRTYSPPAFVLDVALDPRVLAYTAIVCVGVGLLVGLGPALQTRRLNVLSLLGGGARAGTPRRQRRRLQYGVLVPQIALSVILLIVGGAYASALLRIENPDPGYRTEGVIVARVGQAAPEVRPRDWYEQFATRRIFDDELLRRLQEVPGVSVVGLSTKLPVSHSPVMNTRWVTDGVAPSDEGLPAEVGGAVSAGYFAALGIRLLRGRTFDTRDGMSAPRVVIISESFARLAWPGREAIGGKVASVPGSGSKEPLAWKEVIGVVADTRSALQVARDRPVVYSARSQFDVPPGIPMRVSVYGSGSLGALMQEVRRAVEGDPTAQLLEIGLIEEEIENERYPIRAATWLLALSGLAGILLAAIGLYGVVAFSVARQERELGIRATLGATRRDIVTLVLRSGTRVATIAAVPGLVVGLMALRVSSAWFDMAPAVDPLAIGAAVMFVAAVVLSACYVPARRASRVEPMRVLRD